MQGYIKFKIDSKEYILNITRSFPKLEGFLHEKGDKKFMLGEEIPIILKTYTLKGYVRHYVRKWKLRRRKGRK
ncbi:MAG: hypothetical protein HFE90_03265 [Firmicutes bacterium]|nr:hypothetical protein [Bacillota bacterium]